MLGVPVTTTRLVRRLREGRFMQVDLGSNVAAEKEKFSKNKSNRNNTHVDVLRSSPWLTLKVPEMSPVPLLIRSSPT